MTEERRKFQRIEKELLVSYTHAEGIPSGGVVKSTDISLGGIGLVMKEKSEIGMPYNIVIKFPGVTKKFYVTARVANIIVVSAPEGKGRVYRTGLIFVRMAEEQRIILEEQMIKFIEEKEKAAGQKNENQ